MHPNEKIMFPASRNKLYNVPHGTGSFNIRNSVENVVNGFLNAAYAVTVTPRGRNIFTFTTSPGLKKFNNHKGVIEKPS